MQSKQERNMKTTANENYLNSYWSILKSTGITNNTTVWKKKPQTTTTERLSWVCLVSSVKATQIHASSNIWCLWWQWLQIMASKRPTFGKTCISDTQSVKSNYLKPAICYQCSINVPPTFIQQYCINCTWNWDALSSLSSTVRVFSNA